jgi:hypothetical protein
MKEIYCITMTRVMRKKFFEQYAGGGRGVFGLFLIQIYKKCNEGGGEGSKSEKNS